VRRARAGAPTVTFRGVPDDGQALIDAIRAGDADAVAALLGRDPALADARDENGLSAVLVACYHQNPQVRDAVLAAGPELGVLEAAAVGRLDLLRGHLSEDPDALAERTPDGFTPLHLAAFFGGSAAVRALLAAGASADADADNPPHVRPLHSAVAARDPDAVRALLEAGADPNVRQQGGFTPLLAAAHADHPGMTRLLLEHGADPAQAADDGRGPLEMAGDRVRPLLER
jgi:ankyrin repeat protein